MNRNFSRLNKEAVGERLPVNIHILAIDIGVRDFATIFSSS